VVNRGITLATSYDELSRPVALTHGAATVQTWTYDVASLGKGKLASSAVNVEGGAYTQAVSGYDKNGLAQDTSVSIPATQGVLAGTYTRQDRAAHNGMWTGTTINAVNGLPQDRYSANYTGLDQINAVSYGSGALAGTGTFDAFGKLTFLNIGNLQLRQTYESGTQRLAGQVIAPAGAAPVVNATFSYDLSGRVVSIADAGDGAPGSMDRQCFSYDWAGQLRDAWANAEGSCAATSRYSASGPAPYLASYSYDEAYRRTGSSVQSPTGMTTTVLSYPGAGQVRPQGPDPGSWTR